MTKTKIELTQLVKTIEKFYDPAVWHFMTINGVDLGEGKLELQWFFSRYGAKDEIVCFYTETDYETTVPSLVSIIPSAIMGEREVMDLFGVPVEGAAKGLYLDEDSRQMPLRCSL